MADTAFLIPLFTESMQQSGFFLQKKPHPMLLSCQYVKRRYRTPRGSSLTQTAKSRLFYVTDFFSVLFSILAQESFNGRVRLKTRRAGVESGAESGSRQK